MIQNRMNGTKIISLWVFLGLFVLPAGAQTALDSLRKASESAVEDTNLVVACNSLAEEILYDDPWTAIGLSQKALGVSLRISFRDGITWSHSTMAMAFEYTDRLDSAISHYETARRYKMEFSDTQGIARMDLNIGGAYLDRGYYRPAAEAFYRARIVFEKLGDKRQLARTYNNLGMVFRGTKNYRTALDFYQKSLDLKKELGDLKGQALTYTNLSVVFLYTEEIASAERVALEGYELCLANDFAEEGALCMINAAHAAQKRKGYDDCEKYLKEAKRLLDDLGSDYYLADYLMANAEYKGSRDNYSDAVESALDAVALFEKYGRMEQMAKAYTYLSDLYTEMNRPDQALTWLTKSVEMNETIYHRESMRQINEMQILYKTESKERENENLKMEQRLQQVRVETSVRQRNILLISLLVFAILAFVILRLLWQKNQAYNQLTVNKKALETALEQKDTLLRELHHRVKNNLQVVTGLLDLQMARIDDAEVIKALNEGKNRIRSMALIHQKLYRTDDLKSVDMQEYLEKLLQEIQSGFAIPGKEVHADIQAKDVNLDIDVAIPLGLIVNELVTNSFKYAFREADEGSVRISLDKENDKFVLKVSDSGPGYDPAQKTGKATLGLRLVNMLVKQIRGVLEIHNFSGTEVVIQF